ncbi:MAG TPA: metallophosphoesterase [Candidatus Limnocylindrales bacterium]|nr:metallophosphoesterase [Candidatus Limnocylindrales bacterium]
MAFRLLHFADLHLDHSFAGERLSGVGAQRRRDDLRTALTRILELADRQDCDLITCGGDLFDHEHLTRDTTLFIGDTLGAAGRPVMIAPGHSDPAVPSSPYRYLRWPANVTIATHEELRPYAFDNVAIWSGAMHRSDPSRAPLRDFPRIEGGINLLVLHASDMTALPPGATPYAPIVSGQVQECGFGHALLGHYHDARQGPWITYPGSPEPLAFAEPGPHCVALVAIQDDGLIDVTLQPINQRRFVEERLDVTGLTSREQVREAMLALRASNGLDGAVVRTVLTGERARSVDLDPQALAVECGDGFAYLEFRDDTQTAHDLEEVAQEFTSRGEFVRKLAEQDGQESAGAASRAIQLTLDAFDA